MSTQEPILQLSIQDDVMPSIKAKSNYQIDLHDQEIKIYGYGSDGMVSASKDIMHIMGEKKYVQGYFEYDSKKSGGVTISHLRLSDSKIKMHLIM